MIAAAAVKIVYSEKKVSAGREPDQHRLAAPFILCKYLLVYGSRYFSISDGSP